MKADLVVIGAGPAGAAAAAEAAACGLDVVLVDEADRAAAPGGVRTLSGHVVWSVAPGFQIEAVGPAGRVTIEAERVVAATGCIERVVPFPGWTLPGVMGLSIAAASAITPGQRFVVAGCGPLLALAAHGLRSRGAEVVAVATLSDPADRMTPPAQPPSRMLFGHAVRQAVGDGAVQRVEIGPVDAEGRPVGDGFWIEADGLCVGYGLIPGTEITLLLRAPHRFDPARGGWLPVLDAAGRTGIAGLYAAGGVAGVTDMEHAMSGGRVAGRAAARDAGRQAPDDDGLREDAAAGPMQPGPGFVDAIPAETIVCRCEGTTRASIEAAIADGAREMNQIKHFTRCGMGQCQGRICADIIGALLARHVGSRAAAGRWTVRPPLRPLPLDALLGDFDYGDIPVPQPAPL